MGTTSGQVKDQVVSEKTEGEQVLKALRVVRHLPRDCGEHCFERKAGAVRFDEIEERLCSRNQECSLRGYSLYATCHNM